MIMLWVLIPLSGVLLSIAIWAFFWAVDHNQLDDLEAAQRQALDLDGPFETSLRESRDD